MKISSFTFVQLVDANVRGNTFVSVDTCTEPKMRKTDNPFVGVRKYQTKSGVIGFDYSNSINNQALREDKEIRQAKSRKWGVLSKNRIWVLHKGKTYLQLKLQSVSNTRYFMPDGNEVDANELETFLIKSEASSTQEDLDKNIIVNDINIDNILSVRMFGAVWELGESLSLSVEKVRDVVMA